jgi:PAS domain S-box-containing protein
MVDDDVRDRAALFDRLFAQGVTGVFFMKLDEPIAWATTPDREAALDYAYRHLRITSVNDVMCKQIGAPREAVIGTAPCERWGGDPARWREHMRQLYDRGHVLHVVNAPRADGTWLEVEGEYVCTYDDAGRITGHFGTQRDLTDKRRLRERLALSERMASVGTLAAGVGHEINNPLTYIVLNLELLARDLEAIADPARRLRALDRLDQARYGAERVRTIVRDLQDLTRRSLQPTRLLDINALLERTLQIAAHQVLHRARLERVLGAVPPVRGEEGRVVQLFLNLIVNAAQAIPDGTASQHWIRIASGTTPDGRALVEVADSGPGIPAEAIGRIFEPFFTTKEVGEGTGLGLAICRGIIEDLDGEIDVASTPGRGTTFRVVLPAATRAPAPAEVASGGDAAAPRRRVLIVDDEPQLGRILRELLVAHEVTAESSARAALDRLRSGETFDRIVCDLMMPDISGMDFYDELGTIAPALQAQVVFVSGGAFSDRARSFLERVPNRWLSKPFDIAELVAVLV